jgi:hypothetical protein
MVDIPEIHFFLKRYDYLNYLAPVNAAGQFRKLDRKPHQGQFIGNIQAVFNNNKVYPLSVGTVNYGFPLLRSVH